jgi:menaquinone-dependent protoporphyrinogen oxidase
MKILILYGTVEGQTGKIAKFVADELKRLGHEALRANVEDTAELSFDGIDAVILAAPVHQRRHPRDFEALVSARKADLDARKTMMLSVSLSAAFPEGREEAGEYLLEMKMRTGWKPDTEVLVAGAVRTSQYDYFAMQVVRFVVMRNRDYDDSADEHEFTDWAALSKAVETFVAA